MKALLTFVFLLGLVDFCAANTRNDHELSFNVDEAIPLPELTQLRVPEGTYTVPKPWIVRLLGGDEVRNVATCLSAAASILNLLWVLRVFSIQREDRAADRTDKQQDKALDARAFWYRTFILEPHLSKLDQFFRTCEREIEMCAAAVTNLHTHGAPQATIDRVASEYCSNVSERKRSLLTSLGYPLLVIEEELGTSIGQLLDDIQDHCTETFVNNDANVGQSLVELRTKNMALLKAMYVGHISCYRTDRAAESEPKSWLRELFRIPQPFRRA